MLPVSTENVRISHESEFNRKSKFEVKDYPLRSKLRKIANDKYYKKNKEKFQKLKEGYHEANKEKIQKHNKEYYQKNKEKLKKAQKEHYEVDREDLYVKRREKYKTLRQAKWSLRIKLERKLVIKTKTSKFKDCIHH